MQTPMQKRQSIQVYLANPRGFCAGVVRAIKIVEASLVRHGAPVYVRHDIVHNHHVVQRLKKMGAIFVEELSDIPTEDRPVIFSAHGVSSSVVREAEKRGFHIIDATCPLVTKVHKEAERWTRQDHYILFIGHANHPEAIGTTGRIPENRVAIIEDLAAAEQIKPPSDLPLAYVTQTTLSIADCAEIIATLKRRFPTIKGPQTSDICYATSNRQDAVKEIAPKVDVMFVIGAGHSSNSLRLIELSKQKGCQDTYLIEDASHIQRSYFNENTQALGITASASAPEYLVTETCNLLKEWFDLHLHDITTAKENIVFPLPQELR